MLNVTAIRVNCNHKR